MENKNNSENFTPDINRSKLAERIKQTINKVGGISAFSEISGLSISSLGNYTSGRSEPKASVLYLISKFGQTSIDWLITGEEKPDQGNNYINDDFVLLPRYDVEAAAGAGSIIEKEKIRDYLSLKKTWLSNTGISTGNALLLRASGDSMEPTISDGSTILLDISAKALVDNGIYVFESGGLVRIKRFRLKMNALEILSDNNDYPPELVPTSELDNINVIGRVRWFGSYA